MNLLALHPMRVTCLACHRSWRLRAWQTRPVVRLHQRWAHSYPLTMRERRRRGIGLTSPRPLTPVPGCGSPT